MTWCENIHNETMQLTWWSMTQIDFPRQLNAIFQETLLEMDVKISY